MPLKITRANKPKQQNPRKPQRQSRPKATVTSHNPNIIKVLADTNKGTLQNTVNELVMRTKRKLTMEDMNLISGIINPGHQMNIVNARPIPDAGPSKVFVFKTMWREEVKVPAGVTSVSFMTGPSFEAPFLYYDGSKLQTFQISPCMSSANAGFPTVAPYLANHHVYAYRPIGKSMTVENTTAQINKAGACVTGRKTMDIDYTSRQFTTGAQADAVNQPILQRVPLTAAQVTALPSGSTEWGAEQGAYIVAHHNGNYEWIYRKDATTKCFPSSDAGTGNHNCSLKFTDSGTGTLNQVWNYDHPTYNTQSGPADGMDMAIACFTGLQSPDATTTTFTVKCCVAYEFWLKSSSDLNPFVTARKTDLELFNRMIEFESSDCFSAGAFPADYNFWDKVWKAFKNVWNSGGGSLAKAGLDALAPGAGTASKFVGDYLTSQF